MVAGHSFEKAFLLSAGTEATDAALKLMRMHGKKLKKRRRGVICIENNWHGRTLRSSRCLVTTWPRRIDWLSG